MSPPPLPPSVARFVEAADAVGIAVAVVMTAAPARSAEEAAAACGCDVGQIVKSLVFRGRDSGAPLLFLVSGRNRLDEGRAAAAAGEPVERPDAAFVRAATGFAIGGIPPFGHARALRTFLDRDLLAYDVAWAAAGHPNAVFAVAPEALRTAAAAVVAAL